MSILFSRSLRALESERTRGWRSAVVAAALLFAWLAWFLLAQVPLYETTSIARLEVVEAAHPLTALVGGRVTSLRLTVGDRVSAGDVLMELDSGAERLLLDEALARFDGTGPVMAALRDEIAAEERALAEERNAGTAAIEEQAAVTRGAEVTLQVADDEARRTARLRVDGLVAERDEARARGDLDRSRADAEAARAAVNRVTRELRTKESERRVRVQRLEGELRQVEADAMTERATIRRIQYEVDIRLLRAPVDGRIAEAAELRPGAVINVGDRVASIVPDGRLRVVAQFEPSALGRILPGQSARMRLRGFPSAQYGSLSASVASVADEARDGLVRVELEIRDAGFQVPLQHGLPGAAEVEVERVRPVELVLRTVGGMVTQPLPSNSLDR